MSMSYDRINSDGSITRMKGTYNIGKARATIQKTIDDNNRLRMEKTAKQQEDLAEKSARISAFLSRRNEGKSARIEDYVS